MDHVAVDLGSKQSHFCQRDAGGHIIREARVATGDLKRFFGTLPPSRIILETCSEAFTVADGAKEKGHEVRVVASSLAPALGVGLRGVKTDKRDCRQLSMASCRVELGSVHIPAMESRERKALCTQREALVEIRTKLINTVRSWLRTQVVQLATGAVSSFPGRVRKKCLSLPKGLPRSIERILEQVELATAHVKEADRELVEIAEADDVCQRLMSIPGVGPVTAVRFRSAVDDVSRFFSAAAVSSYFGLTPGEDSSSQRQRRTGVTKAGQADVRRCLVQAAWNLMRHSADSDIGRWACDVAERRGKQKAAVAVARKLAGILFALWRDGTTFVAVKHVTEESLGKLT